MKHEFEIDGEAGLLTETFAGEISLDLLTAANTAILNHPEFTSGLNFLTDLREARISFGYNEMGTHVRNLPRLQVVKQAFVIARDSEYGMIRMFIILTDGKGIFEEARIFRSMEDGVAWCSR